MRNYVREAKEIIAENIYMTIATASQNGEPWISPVFFTFDQSYNFYWASNRDAKHSKLIRENEHVAIVIFNSSVPEGEGDGVYFEAAAVELNEEEDVRNAMALLKARVTIDDFAAKSIEDVTGSGVWRLYRATPQRAYKLGEGEYVNGQYIDKKVEIELVG